MKAERRHELRENDLAHAIGVARLFIDKHSKPIGTAAIVLLLAVVVIALAIRSSAAASEDRWRRMTQLQFNAEDIEASKAALEQLAAMTQSTSEASFVLAGLIQLGNQSLRLAQEVPFPPDRDLTERARAAYERLLNEFSRNPLAVGVARCGLATVEENLFQLSGDPVHKERAGAHLTAVIEDPRLSGLPFQKVAVERRAKLDETFQLVRFAPLTEDVAEAAPEADQADEVPLPPPDVIKTLPAELREKLEALQEESRQPAAQPRDASDDDGSGHEEQPVEESASTNEDDPGQP